MRRDITAGGLKPVHVKRKRRQQSTRQSGGSVLGIDRKAIAMREMKNAEDSEQCKKTWHNPGETHAVELPDIYLRRHAPALK